MTNKKKKNLIFWTLQILAWFSISGLYVINYFHNGNDLNLKTWQVILDFICLALICILITYFLRVLLNKVVKFDNINGVQILKMFALFLGTSILIYLSYLLYVQLMYTYVYDRIDVFDHPSQSRKNHLIFFINFSFYSFIWLLFYVAIKSLRELNESRLNRVQLESTLRESQLNTLKGQINPHFMFNSLNNIRGLMLEDVNRSREMLTRLSEMLRYSLTKNDVNSISVEEELEMVDNYVEISKIQLEDRLIFNKNIDETLLESQIPPMIIQLLVENAVKHGISNLKNGGEIILSVYKEESSLYLVVKNTGKLIINKSSTQLGLKNIEKRLSLLYGEEATFSLVEEDNEVVATIKIPLS